MVDVTFWHPIRTFDVDIRVDRHDVSGPQASYDGLRGPDHTTDILLVKLLPKEV